MSFLVVFVFHKIVGQTENGTLATGVPFLANNQIGFIVVEGDGRIYGNVDSAGSDTAFDTEICLKLSE